MAGGEGSVPAACACMGQDNRWGIKVIFAFLGYTLPWGGYTHTWEPLWEWPQQAQHLTEKPSPSQWGAVSTGCKSGKKAIIRFITVLFYPALCCGCVAGRVYRCLEPPFPLPSVLGQLCPFPLVLSTSSGSHQCSQPLPRRKGCATNQMSKGKFWKFCSF